MGNEGKFPIEITGDATSLVAAMQQTNQALESNKIQLSNLKPETEDYIRKLKQSEDASKELDISHRNLRLGLHMLGPEFAEAGHLGVAAFANPLTAGLLAVGVMAGKLISDWQRMKDAIGTAPDISGINKVTEALGGEGMLKALQEGITAADEFWSKLNRLANVPIPTKDKIEDAMGGQKKEHDAADKILSGKEKAELAELNLAKTQGKISAGQYEIKKGEIEDRYAGQRANRQVIGEDQVIEARKHEREVAQRVVAEGPEVITPKQIAAEEAKGRLEGQKAELEVWKKKLGEIDKWFQEKGPAALGSAEGRGVYAEQDKARRLAHSETVNREMGTIPEAERTAKATAAGLAEAQRKVEEAQSRAAALDREIPKLEGDRTRNRATQEGEVAPHRRVRAAEGEGALTEALNKGKEQETQLHQQIIRAAQSGAPVNAAVMDALHAQEAHNLKVLQELTDYSRRIHSLEGKAPRI